MAVAAVLVADSDDERRAALVGLLLHPAVRVIEARDGPAARISTMLDGPVLAFVHEEIGAADVIGPMAAQCTVVLVSEAYGTGDAGAERATAEVAERGAHAFLGLPPHAATVRRGAERILGVSYEGIPVPEGPDDAATTSDLEDGELDAEAAEASDVTGPADLVPEPAAEPSGDEGSGVSAADESALVDSFTGSRAQLEVLYGKLEWASYYDILGIERIASPRQIRQAFRERATMWHPDGLQAHPDMELREKAYEVYKRMAEAYRILLDGPQRRAYDMGLPEGRLRYLPETRVTGLRAEDLMPPQARKFYAAGLEALEGKDLLGARNALRVALSLDPGNHLIEEKLKLTEQ